MAVRKLKRLTLTQTAWDEVKAEALKAGVSAGEAVRLAVVEGWGGFKAGWLESAKSGSVVRFKGRTANRQLDVEAENRRVADEWLAQEAEKDAVVTTSEVKHGTA
jgi:hypothetical protein